MNPLTPVAVAIGRQSWMPKLLPVVVKVDTGPAQGEQAAG